MQDEGVSVGLANFFAQLSPEDRESLTELLRQPATFIAEDMRDVIAILRGLEA